LLDSEYYDYYSGLMKTMSVSELKAHFCAELKTINAGEGIIVLDHNHPVAQVIPYKPKEKIGIRAPQKLYDFKNYSPLLEGDSLAPLLEDRGRR
jgi:antitoxin (DNA-binding transcriptional repressor) of toxin-antitoxin stability system